MSTTAKAKAVPVSSAPPIVPGVTRVVDGKETPVVREVVLVTPEGAGVYLAHRFEIDEIRYFVTEPTKRKPDGKAEWRTVPRCGAPGFSVRAP